MLEQSNYVWVFEAVSSTISKTIAARKGSQKARQRDRVLGVRIRLEQVLFEALQLGIAERTTEREKPVSGVAVFARNSEKR